MSATTMTRESALSRGPHQVCIKRTILRDRRGLGDGKSEKEDREELCEELHIGFVVNEK